jgi:hypothetical protein
MSRKQWIRRAVISALAAMPALGVAQEAARNMPGPAQSQVISKWQTPALNDFPFESALQLGFAPELLMVSLAGLAAADGSAVPGTRGTRTTAIPMMQNETVTSDLAGIKVKMKASDNDTDLSPCDYALTLTGSSLTVRMNPGLRCKLASADWANIRLEFRVFAIK